MKMKINEKKNYLISEIAGSKAIFTKRNVFNFSRFLEMNQETIESFRELEKLFQNEKEDINSLYVPNAEHTNKIINIDDCKYYKMVQYNQIVLKMPKPLCDGILTQDNSKSLIVFPGDCIVVAGIDKESGTRFIFHAGWRGVASEIAKSMSLELKKLGVLLKNMEIIIFPSISKKHFTLDKENAKYFLKHEAFVSSNDDENYNIDLVEILKSQLTSEGFLLENIQEISYCTYSASDKNGYMFNSYRRDKSIQRNAAILLGKKEL